MSGHTPGPWFKSLGKEKIGIEKIMAAGQKHIASVFTIQKDDRITQGETEANIRLIADAPKTKRDRDELLAAAKMAYETLSSAYAWNGYQSPPHKIPVLEKLEAAIARAEGRE